MIEKVLDTNCGQIRYWLSEQIDNNLVTLVFLPGLTADHRLFDRQTPHFEGRMNVLTWDAPGHALSWKLLVKAVSEGVATTEYGRQLMREMMMDYGGVKSYAPLVGHGYRMLAEAMEADLPYEIKCPALLICGEKDKAGSTKRYNKAWHKATGIPIEWIPEAGHNSNTDAPELVNELIDRFIQRNNKSDEEKRN